MKKIIITLLIIVAIVVKSQAQNYIGKNWIQVQYLLAAKKASNENLFVETLRWDSINKAFETINLAERTSDRLWVLISTEFDTKGVCYIETYSDFQSKLTAKSFAENLFTGFKLVYSSSINDGLMDKYIVMKDGRVSPYILNIGSTRELPEDIMVAIIKR
ncbi:MAG: hypothetical protein B7X86_14455 [Sphingobacteriales bacterium 17-39-43]|uniref:hypothetical protein n=1 Tax=Daejeonella sp. TaxID=2805397 RepID=UPI000BD40684|nr:hypothetical protein [Daejeonella sp.]OYZ30149.1 MAG: hypothetical protein B7Y24_14220 [Sphingobacteriales bacterium 16-39-50]OZA22867.1 MAG: hypothetical protein B7X86_14455 [Sphingobacteriales bacterium 17-39-43]HQT23982.1 hypothetical protein [Daejeonella sp.]HQT58646.1 hypothetical protein [Daejeonella sp.]